MAITGMCFNFDIHGNLTAMPSLVNAGSAPNDTVYGGDNSIVGTGCPIGSSPQNIIALLQGSAVLGFPFTPNGVGPLRFQKSHSAIVAKKPPNKAGKPAAEAVERRGGTKGNTNQQSTRRAQIRESVSQALDRVRQAAVQRLAAFPPSTRGRSRMP